MLNDRILSAFLNAYSCFRPKISNYRVFLQIKHFEPIWGDNANVLPNIASSCTKEFHSPKSSTTKMTTIKRPPSPLLRNRTVGAVTRSVSMYHEKREAEELGQDRTKKIKLGNVVSQNEAKKINQKY